MSRLALRRLPLAVLAVLLSWPAAAKDINVGGGRAITTLAAAVRSAGAGDRILLDPGIYNNDTATTSVPLTIEGLGGGAFLNATRALANRKGIIITNASLTVRNLTFNGANVSEADGNNGAGIRAQAGNLTVENCVFSNNQTGILVNPINGANVSISGSTFAGNGAGDGYSHGIYVNEVAQFTVADSTFTGTKVGHNIKSRALNTVVRNTILDDGVVGTTSYAIDLPNGGVAVIDGVTITQGFNTQNSIMIAYGAEGDLKPANSLTVTNSTFVNRPSTGTAVRNFTDVAATLTANTYRNVPTRLSGNGQVGGDAPGLRSPVVFSRTQTSGQSYLRFYNGGTTAGTVTVELDDPATGLAVARWTSPSIPPGASPQYAVATVEGAAPLSTVPPFYTLAVTSRIDGAFQQVLYQADPGVLVNLSTCDKTRDASALRLINVHSSALNYGFPSSIAIQNTGGTAASADIGVYDARDGTKLGVYSTGAIPPSGQGIIDIAAIEQAIGVSPTAALNHYNLKVENAFTGVLQHLIVNKSVGMAADMTATCPLSGS